MKQFLLGSSWNSFKIINCCLPEDASPEDITINLHILSQYYDMKLEYVVLDELICFEILLEDLPPSRRHSRSTRSTTPLDENKKRKTQIFKIAVSVGYKILFCNRQMSKHFREIFRRVFRADSLEPYNLNGSPPCDLLLLYRQSFNSDKNLDIQNTYLELDGEADKLLFGKKSLISKLYPERKACPKIRNIVLRDEVGILQSADKGLKYLKDIRIGEIKLEVNSKSIFDYYLDLEKLRCHQTFPRWITDCKELAQTKLDYIAG